MKNFFFTFIALLFINLTSCNKNSENNILIINDQPYEISQGFISYKGNVYNDSSCKIISIQLYSEDIDVAHTEDNIPIYVGYGNLISLTVYSESPRLEPGEYIYNSDTVAPYQIFGINYVTNHDFSSSFTNVYKTLKEGKLTVKKTFFTYELEFKMVDKYDNEITGFYKGKLAYYDYTD